MTYFGAAILFALFVLGIGFRKRFAALIQKVQLPRPVLFLLSAIPLIVAEEHVNCGAYHCTSVLFPPTLTVLIIFELLLLVGVSAFHSKTILVPTMLFSILGIAFERFFGVLAGIRLTLAIVLLIIPWLGVSYAFLVILPLTVLQETRD